MVRFISQADYAPGSLQPLGPGLGDVLASVFSARRAAEAQRQAEARQATLDKAKIEEAQYQRAQSEIQKQLQLRRAGIEEAQAGAAGMSMGQAPGVSAVSQGIPEIEAEEAGPKASELVVPQRRYTAPAVVDPRTGQTLMQAATLPLKYKEDIAAEKEQEKLASGELIQITDDMRASLPPGFQGFKTLPRTTLERFETARQAAETAKAAAKEAQEGRKELATIAAGGRAEAREERAAERAAREAEKTEQAEQDTEGYIAALQRGDIGFESVPANLRGRIGKRAEKEGIDTRTKGQREIDAGADQAVKILDDLEAQARKTITGGGGLTGKAAAAGQRLGAALGYAPETQIWESKTSQLGLLARQLGEKGVLSQSDIDRIAQGLPNLTDSPEIRDRKLATIRSAIETGIRAKASSRALINQSGRASASDPLGLRSAPGAGASKDPLGLR